MYVAKDPDRALADLDDVVKARPSNAVAHQTIGLALRRLGRFDEALDAPGTGLGPRSVER